MHDEFEFDQGDTGEPILCDYSHLDPVRDAELIAWYRQRDAQDREEWEARQRAQAQRRRLNGIAAPLARRRSRPLDFGDQRGVSPPIAVRLPHWLDEQLRRAFGELGVTLSEGTRQVLEEWCVTRLFPALEYRDASFPRFAAIRGGPTVLEWLAMEPRPALEGGVREQVEDYVTLVRARVEARLEQAAARKPAG